MTGWNPQLTRLRQQLAQVALTPGADLAERSAAALEALGRVLPSDAAWLAVRDPEPPGRAGPAPGAPPPPPAGHHRRGGAAACLLSDPRGRRRGRRSRPQP